MSLQCVGEAWETGIVSHRATRFVWWKHTSTEERGGCGMTHGVPSSGSRRRVVLTQKSVGGETRRSGPATGRETTMQKEQRIYTREFKVEAVHLVQLSSTYFRRHPSKGIHGGMNDRKRKQKSFFCVSMGAGLTYRINMSSQGKSVACLDWTCLCGTLVAAIAASETAATRLGAVIKRIGSATGSPFN